MDFDVPVVLLAYNRPALTRRVFDVIAKMRPSQLFFLGDGPRHDHATDETDVAAVRQIASLVDWPCELFRNFSPRHLGCGLRVSSGLDWVFRSVDRAIILEDDCLPSLDFFTFCRDMLAFYEHDNRVGTIAGTNLAVGFQRFPGSYLFTKYFASWGWACWRRSWTRFDWQMSDLPQAIEGGQLRAAFRRADVADYFASAFTRTAAGGVDSWAYPMLYHSLMNRWLHAVPTRNLVSNLGFGQNATHTTDSASPFAYIPAEQLTMPLRHPGRVLECSAFEDIIETRHLGLPPRQEP